MLSHKTFKVQVTKSMFSFLLNLMFWVASLWLCRCFKHIPWPLFNHWNFVAYIGCTSPFRNYANIICYFPSTCFKSTNKCCMNILFSVTSKISLKMRSQIFFSRSSMPWGARFVPSVCYEEGMIIRQGLNMLFNPPFIVPLSEP
jgi:hypothetical protein